MKAFVCWLIALAGLVLAAPGMAQPPARAGLYVADQFEMDSMIMLQDDGSFRWYLSYGALDMTGEGRWTGAGDAVVLNSDPPVIPPTVELIRSRRSREPGVLIRLDADSRVFAPILDVEVRYVDGSSARDPFQGEEHRVAAAPDRPIAVILIGSAVYNFQSEPFPVAPDGDNVLTFRFVRNGMGREDFRGTRLAVDGDVIVLDWRGTSIRYARVDSEAAAGLTSLSPPRREPPPPAASQGAVEAGLGEPVADMVARSTYTFELDAQEGPVLGSEGAVDLRLRLAGRSLDLGRIGGGDHIPWAIDRGMHERIVTGVRFHYQDRLLTLEDALDRARSLEQWLVAGGFAPRAPSSNEDEASLVPFSVIDPYRMGETAADWDSAARLLAEDDPGVDGMSLYFLRSGDWFAVATLQNLRRMSTDDEGHVWFETEAGRDWRLEVTIHMDPALVMAVDFPTEQR